MTSVPSRRRIDWIKWHIDFFEGDLWRSIEGTPVADSICTVRLQLICLAARCNDGGAIYNRDTGTPYTCDQLARYFRREPLGFSKVLELLIEMGHFTAHNGVIQVVHWTEVYSPDAKRERDRLNQRNSRERRRSFLRSQNTLSAPVSEDNDRKTLDVNELNEPVSGVANLSAPREEKKRRDGVSSSSSEEEDEKIARDVRQWRLFDGIDEVILKRLIGEHGNRVALEAEKVHRSHIKKEPITHPLAALKHALQNGWDAPTIKANRIIPQQLPPAPENATDRPLSDERSQTEWVRIQDRLRSLVTAESVDRWFKDTVPVLSEKRLTLWTPNRAARSWIEENYLSQLVAAADGLHVRIII